MIEDLNGLTVILAVADTRSFSAAATRLGVTASAVSQSVRRLEERHSVVLVQRTTRSVRLTEAGERFCAALRPALAEVRAAVAALGALGDAPRGTLRLHAGDAAESFLRGPLLAKFLAAHHHVDLDVTVSNAPVDIVADGYDAGIQLGEVIDRDMIADPVSGDVRLIVVASPAYLVRCGLPRHPRDLAQHDVLNWHATPEAPPYRWEFTEKGHDFSVAVRARVLTTDPALLLGLARAGAGLAMLYENQVRDDITRGELAPVLEEFSAPFPGFYLYYPQRRQASGPLRALIEYLRKSREPATRRTSGRRAR